MADTTAGGTVPATLSLSLGDRASFAAFIPGVARDYEASLGATVTSTGGEASLSVVDPVTATAGRLVNGAFTLAQPVQAAVTGAFAPVGATPRTLHATTARSATTRSRSGSSRRSGRPRRCAPAPTPRR